ncbi:hypothetical protein SRB5_18210 [Streptomyces sp. RB5]|uniref:DUF4865 domain-containing protein n=1 Tax=Streptomyces smaragdinus TaxID=2585196 RepID=A0A7K0CF83_9ACTN|nr:DUF4865 family protein [Streptomyces smaragdinus]MQY11702.1 hypothetical protein [Streptomyces smaragdinus]
MHAMRYGITLPADYDMGIIRARVAAKGHLTDAFPGLGLKAFAVRERGVDGSPVNQYAPFYLWRTPEGMNGFLWGDGFRGIVRDFGRPVVEHWVGAGFVRGAAYGARGDVAVRRTRAVLPGEDAASVVEEERAALGKLAGAEGLRCAAVGVDPRTWEVVAFSLWAGGAAPGGGERYEVLHVSAPEVDGL